MNNYLSSLIVWLIYTYIYILYAEAGIDNNFRWSRNNFIISIAILNIIFNQTLVF